MSDGGEPRDADHALLEAILTHAPLGLGAWDGDLRFRRVNAELAAINGVPAEDHLGRTPEEVLGPSLGAEIRSLLERVLRTGQPVLDRPISGETSAARGVIRHWRASYLPVRDEAGAVFGVTAAVVEVTEQHVAEVERRRLLKEAITSRAHAEAAQLRAEEAQVVAERARERLAFLSDADQRLASSMEYETTLQRLAEIAVPTIADWCVITLLEPGGLRTVAIAHFDAGLTRFAQELGDRHRARLAHVAGAGRVIESGEMEFFPRVSDELIASVAGDAAQLRILRDLNLSSSVVVPLASPDGVIGTLSFAMAESGRRFSGEDASLITDLAARAALHIRNAQLYTERSHIARTLQAGLLPRVLPDIPGLEVAAEYLAAGESDVGGDFYDVFPNDEGVWTALIGDVTGKGPEAAAVTSLARHTLRTASLSGERPSENLRLLNRAMLADAESTRFCTVVYARVRPSPGAALITVANGGHLPPLLLRADGTLESIEVAGTLVGGVPDPVFADRDIRLDAGDLLLLYTDGVTELRTADPHEGEARLAEVLRASAGRTAAEVVAAVCRRAVELQGGRPRDDIALLALRVLPSAA